MTQQPHEIIWSLTNAIVASRSLHVVAEIGVADQISDEPVNIKELASACNADVDALDRVLRLLAAHGIFEATGEGYGHTEPSRLLRTDHPMSMRAFSRMMGLPVFFASFGELEHSVRTGSPSLELAAPEGLWPYLQDHPSERDVFGQAMTAKAAADIQAVIGAYDFSRFNKIADVGGGRGHLLCAVLDAAVTAEGILFELPEVIDTLDLQHDRMRTHAGDFFVDPLPGADAYILMDIIHDWPDAEAAAILTAIRSASDPGAKVLIIETIIPEGDIDPSVQTLDIIMLSVTGGRERTAKQLGELLNSAGFRLNNVIQTSGALRIVEAVAT
jgi:C-methyltransferase